MPTLQPFSRMATSRFLPTVLLCGFTFSGAVAADLPIPVNREAVRQIDSATRQIEIRESDSLLLEYPGWLTTVKSFDPALIRVSAVRPNCLRIQRITHGKTTLLAIDRDDHRYSVEVIVRASTDGK